MRKRDILTHLKINETLVIFGHAQHKEECDEINSWRCGLVKYITPGGLVRVMFEEGRNGLCQYHFIRYIVTEWWPDGTRPNDGNEVAA